MWGNDSWATMPLTTKGSREILIGIEVDIITADFPLIDIQEATAEIKASRPRRNDGDQETACRKLPNGKQR